MHLFVLVCWVSCLQCALQQHVHILALQAHSAAEQGTPSQGLHATVHGEAVSGGLRPAGVC